MNMIIIRMMATNTSGMLGLRPGAGVEKLVSQRPQRQELKRLL
jgi:hypothetical protein